jgi:hypothetical protein
VYRSMHLIHCKKDMSGWKTCPCLSPPVPICSLRDAISAPIRTILCSVRQIEAM